MNSNNEPLTQEMSQEVEISVADTQPLLEPKKEDLPKVVSEIDEYLAKTFDAMSVIDESYGKVSSFFIEMSNQRFGDRDFDTLSKNEQKEAMLYMGTALAVQGVCAVTKGIKETIALENVKQLHRTVAEKRRESLPRQIERVRRLHCYTAMPLLSHNGHPFSTAKIKNSFRATADLLETELCQYRDVRFRLDMLLWLQDEYDAWLEGRLYSNTPMPTIGQATIAAIYLLANKRVHACRVDLSQCEIDNYQIISSLIEAAQPPVSRENLETDLRQFGVDLADGLDLTKFPNGKDFISAFEILAVTDAQMASVLEYYSIDRDPFARARAEADSEDDEADLDMGKVMCNRLYAGISLNCRSTEYPQIHDTLENNPTAGKSLFSLDAFYDMKAKYDTGSGICVIKGLLVAAALILPVWQFGWAWYWALVLSAVIFFTVQRRVIRKSARGVARNFVEKYSGMNKNYEYIVTQDAGLIEPVSKVKEMARHRNHFWIGLILGGVAGSFFFPPLGTILGALFGAIIGTSYGDSDDHGKGWKEIKIYSPTKQWIAVILTFAIVLFEIYAFFIR